LFPITVQLLRCLPFERSLFYPLLHHLSRLLETKITDVFYFIGSSDYKTIVH